MATQVGVLTAKLEADIGAFTSKLTAAQTAINRLTTSTNAMARANQLTASATGGLATALSHAQKSATGAGAGMAKAAQSSKATGTAMAAAATHAASAGKSVGAVGTAARAASADMGLLGKFSLFASTRLAGIGHISLFAGAGLAGLIALPIAAFMTGAAKAAIQFEDAFALVEKTVGGRATEAALDGISDGLRRMALEVPIAAAELAEMASIAGQLGVQVSHILTFTRVVAEMGVATNLAGEQAAFALARLDAILGTTTRQGAEGFRNLADAIVHLGNNMAATESEIVETGLRMAGVAKTVELTEGQVLGLAAGMRALGRPTGAATTALQRAFQVLQQGALEGGDRLALLNKIAGVDMKKAFEQDAAGALIAFLQGLNRVNAEGGNVFKTLKDLELGTQRTTRELLAMANGVSTLIDGLEFGVTGFEQTNALADEAAKRFGTTASQLKLLGNSAREVGISFGNQLLGPIKAVISTLRSFFDALSAAPPIFQQVVLGAAALVASLLALSVAGRGLSALTGAISSLLGLKGIMQGVATTTLQTSTAFSVTATSADYVGKVIGSRLAPAILAVVRVLQLAARAFLAFAAFQVIGYLLELSSGFQRVREEALEVANIRFPGFVFDLEQVGANIREMVHELDAVKEAGEGAFDFDLTTVQGNLDAMRHRIGFLRDEMEGMAQESGNAFKEIFDTSTVGSFMDLLRGEIDSVDDVISRVKRSWEGFKDVLGMESEVEDFRKLQAEVEALEQSVDFVKAAYQSAEAVIAGSIEGAIDPLERVAAKHKELGLEAGQMAQLIEGHWQGLSNAAQRLGGDADALTRFILTLFNEGAIAANKFLDDTVKASQGAQNAFAALTPEGAILEETLTSIGATSLDVASALDEMGKEGTEAFLSMSSALFKFDVENIGAQEGLAKLRESFLHNTAHAVEWTQNLEKLAERGATALARQFENAGPVTQKALREALELPEDKLREMELEVAVALSKAKANADVELDKYPANFGQKVQTVLETWQQKFAQFAPISTAAITSLGLIMQDAFKNDVTAKLAEAAGRTILEIQRQLEAGAKDADLKPLVDKLEQQLKDLKVPQEVIDEIIRGFRQSGDKGGEEAAAAFASKVNTIENSLDPIHIPINGDAITGDIRASIDRVKEIQPLTIPVNVGDAVTGDQTTGALTALGQAGDKAGAEAAAKVQQHMQKAVASVQQSAATAEASVTKSMSTAASAINKDLGGAVQSAGDHINALAITASTAGVVLQLSFLAASANLNNLITQASTAGFAILNMGVVAAGAGAMIALGFTGIQDTLLSVGVSFQVMSLMAQASLMTVETGLSTLVLTAVGAQAAAIVLLATFASMSAAGIAAAGTLVAINAQLAVLAAAAAAAGASVSVSMIVSSAAVHAFVGVVNSAKAPLSDGLGGAARAGASAIQSAMAAANDAVTRLILNIFSLHLAIATIPNKHVTISGNWSEAIDRANAVAAAINRIDTYVRVTVDVQRTGDALPNRGGFIGPAGYVGYHSGGQVEGPRPVFDTVPALLTPGEFVLRADVVRRVGLPFLRALNAGKITEAMRELIDEYEAAGRQVLQRAGGTTFSMVQTATSAGKVATSSGQVPPRVTEGGGMTIINAPITINGDHKDAKAIAREVRQELNREFRRSGRVFVDG